MDFWDLISNTVSRPLSVDAASKSAGDALRALSVDDTTEFCREFDEKMKRAYTWDLWGLAYLINGGCSDDTFMDFRSSLILLGKDVYEGALQDAESLLSLDGDELQELFEEGALYIAANACEEKGIEVPSRGPAPPEPTGEPWDETREDLMARFPKAWPVYGWEEPSAPVAVAPQESKPWWKLW